MRVHVDPSLCQGHNRCVSIAPRLFQTDEFGYASARSTGAVEPGLADQARLAVANCPEFAVTLTDD